MSQSGTYNVVGGGGGGAILTLTGNTGGAVGPDGFDNINILGVGGVEVAGDPGTNTLSIEATGGGLEWFVVAINTAMAPNDGYIANAVGQIQLLLPAVAPVGSIVRAVALTAGGWQITQGAGQSIRFGNMITTVGAGGSLTSTAIGDAVELVCAVANTGWIALSGIGNINVT
jgi:hypothetical protein